MESKKGLTEPMQAEEYIRTMIKKRRLLTGAELGNCLLCRIGYDIPDPTDEFILKTTQHWTAQADLDAYYLRLEIRDFLMLLHNSAVYAQAKAKAESINIVQVIAQIAKQRIATTQFEMLYNTAGKRCADIKKNKDKPDIKGLTKTEARLFMMIYDFRKEAREYLGADIKLLLEKIASERIKEFTESLTFVLNADAIIDLFAEFFNLDLHTYKTKRERTREIWRGVDMLDNENITGVIDNALKEKIIDKETHRKAINIVKQASSINTKEATPEEKAEVMNALKELRTQADFIHIREWIIGKLIKTHSFI